MNTNSCYAGHQGNAPVIPSLLASSLLTGVVVDESDQPVADALVRAVDLPGTVLSFVCTRNELLKKAFGDEG